MPDIYRLTEHKYCLHHQHLGILSHYPKINTCDLLEQKMCIICIYHAWFELDRPMSWYCNCFFLKITWISSSAIHYSVDDHTASLISAIIDCFSLRWPTARWSSMAHGGTLFIKPTIIIYIYIYMLKSLIKRQWMNSEQWRN